MKLLDYLEQNEMTDAEFAELIGVKRQSIYRYRTGERMPEWPIVARIMQVTEGQVTANDFLPVARAAE